MSELQERYLSLKKKIIEQEYSRMNDMQRQAVQVMDAFMTDIFGKELTPWQREENQAAAAST